ncbi:MAG: ABC transporter permease [Clostridia bacterium]|nr:ABC transporter permease [Clostridia bacterium]
MRRLLAFTKKNFIEVKRSPIYFVFSLIFPILFILLLTIMDKATEDTATGTFINFMKYPSLVPGTMMISCCLPMYFMAAIVSNDRKSALLKRQYISPMRTPEFILGYAIVGFVLGIALLFICYFGG